MFQLIGEHMQERPSARAKDLCVLVEGVGLSRSSFYRYSKTGLEGTKSVAEVELRDAIQRVALEWPTYGYRMITAELARRGITANHKRVLRLMHEDNLLCLRQRSFIATTDSDHSHRIYPNLAAKMVPTNINQLWVADITYIRLLREFVYLAVILDAFSRRCIGWALGRRLTADLALAALQLAIETRRVPKGLIHHSDRGAQYASDSYTGLLNQHGILISMSRKGNPYDNAKAERFIRTLKYEQVYLSDYETMTEIRNDIGRFIDQVYNQKRLHSSIGYLPPAEFEQSLVTQLCS